MGIEEGLELLCLMSKILKMKAIHNMLSFSLYKLKAVVSDVKDTENESNSQPVQPITGSVLSCCV